MLTLFMVFCLSCTPLFAMQEHEPTEGEIVLEAEGMAALDTDAVASEEEAIWDAKRNAVEQAAGVFLKAQTTALNFEMERDEIQSTSRGFIRKWEVVEGSRRVEKTGNARVLRIRIRATVALLRVLKKLQELQDVFKDLERPRLFVQMNSKGDTQGVRTFLRNALQEQGFLLADAPESAAILVIGHFETTPLVQMKQKETPFGVGESVATCRARLTFQLSSSASEETLLALHEEAVGSSFQSDADALQESLSETTQTFWEKQKGSVVQVLLMRWARERQDGHIVALEVQGLTLPLRENLREQVSAMRGFRIFIGENLSSKSYTLRFQTRLRVQDVRRRLSALKITNRTLELRNTRGNLILCTLRPRTAQR